MKRTPFILSSIVLILATILAGCGQPVATSGLNITTADSVIVVYDGKDSAPLVAAALKLTNTVTLSPGYHKWSSVVYVPPGKTIRAFGAKVEVTTSYPFALQGLTTFRGGEYFGVPTAPKKFATGTSPAAGADCQWVTFNRGIGWSSQNISTTTIKNCTLYGSGEFNSAIIDDCDFYGGNYGSQDARNGDWFIRGSTSLTNSRLYESRLVANQGGLNKATLKNVTWYFKNNLGNEGECILFETCNVVDSTFSNLYFHGTRLCIEFYGITGAFNMTGNTFKNITSDTSHTFFLATTKGTVKGNTFDGVFLSRVTNAIYLDVSSQGNKFTNFHIDSAARNARADGIQPKIESMPLIIDNGATPSSYQVFITNRNGVPIANKPLPGIPNVNP